MDERGGCATKGVARRRRRYIRRRDNQPANRGKQKEMRQRTRVGGALIAEVAAEAELRGREAGASIRQPAGKRETTMAMAKEKVTVMATENAALPPSQDLVNAHLGPRD